MQQKSFQKAVVFLPLQQRKYKNVLVGISPDGELPGKKD